MALYYLHLRDSSDELLDPDGGEYASAEARKGGLLKIARHLIATDAPAGKIDMRYRIDAEDGDGTIFDSIRCTDAVQVIEHR